MAEKQKQLEEMMIKEDGGDDLLVGFNLLPEVCTSTILSLSFTSPRDVVRSFLVSSIFKSAAETDSVWENFLPSIYPEILSRSLLSSSSLSSSSTTTTSLLGGFSSKKDLCCSLIDKPILIDGGLKSFGLERGSGKICVMLGAKDLSIVWGSDPKCWRWGPFSESRFSEVAMLKRCCWIEITGKVETRMLSPKTTYGIYFVIKTIGYENVLNREPILFRIRVLGEYSGHRSAYLSVGRRLLHQQKEPGHFPRERGDGWMEIEMGEFYNDGEENGEVEIHLVENSYHVKRGLIVQGMEIRPKVST